MVGKKVSKTLISLAFFFFLRIGATIGYSYEDREHQHRKDEKILAEFLGEEVEESEEKAFSSESEYGEREEGERKGE